MYIDAHTMDFGNILITTTLNNLTWMWIIEHMKTQTNKTTHLQQPNQITQLQQQISKQQIILIKKNNIRNNPLIVANRR